MPSVRFFQTEVSPPLPPKASLKKWILKLIASHGHSCGEINIIFCGDNYLHSINKQYLNHDTLTDIITFHDSVQHPNGGLILSGELYISSDMVARNAATFGVTVQEELLRVIAHGVLHLCGFGDKTPSEKRNMRKQESLALMLFKSF